MAIVTSEANMKNLALDIAAKRRQEWLYDIYQMGRDAIPAGASGVAYALDPRSNDSFIAVNRLLKTGGAVYRAATPIRVGDREWPAGAFLLLFNAILLGGLEKTPPRTDEGR